MFCFNITLAFFLVVYSADATYQNGQNSKRLLLDDPDIIIKRISNMEKHIAQLQSDLSGEKSNNVNLESQMAILQTKNADVEKEVTQLKAELGDEKNKYVTLRQTVDAMKTPGSIYVRWRRKTCSGLQTELVYTGFAAGQNHYDPDVSTHFGGAANLLCLPNNPELGNRSAPGISYLYGTEYEQSFFGNHAIDEDVPCALCRSINAYTSVMIPGRRSCYGGWRLEYHGLLASDSYAHKASSFICVDESPEYLQGGKDNKNGNLLYGTGTKCGSLPCPPYTENTSVNCVVCSKLRLCLCCNL